MNGGQFLITENIKQFLYGLETLSSLCFSPLMMAVWSIGLFFHLSIFSAYFLATDLGTILHRKLMHFVYLP
ncbi:hypothetical protein HMPREF0620_0943 [Parascardovia denticolens DSM 10105 = JCM 12538]|uniref:Uncharacterized protein n=1 Tax=Parascardovia denticolens DSM 10105 = JCM 12538 TaxID=864564 RepID=E6JZ48_PARDN|nr:hypothetical protein HMPREF0620_0943 [Parascardovia denticolens DSM 10105 = JCM 12538]